MAMYNVAARVNKIRVKLKHNLKLQNQILKRTTLDTVKYKIKLYSCDL
jgi:hypothetical protein